MNVPYDAIKACIMSISYQERRKKKLQKYRRELILLKEMDEDELDFEYINSKSEYEHKKNVISIFMLSLVIAVLIDAWKYFFQFVEKILQYAVLGQGNEAEETVKAVFMFAVVIVVAITIAAVGILIEHTRRMYELNKYLMCIEKIRKKRNCFQ